MNKNTITAYLVSPWTIQNGKATAPVTLVTEGVHCGSEGCILWKDHILKENASKWNNIPVTLEHPMIDGSPVSVDQSSEIHNKFAEGETLKKLEQYSINKPSQNARDSNKNKYVRFNIQPQNLHRFFQRSNVNSLSSKIRAVHNGEEITFEQVLIADNPPSENFIIIDRQVTDHANKSQMDLLALRRDSKTKPFHFLVIELKLGKNPDLHGKVGGQLIKYIGHIREYMQDYVTCYKENYRQKKELGLFDSSLPDEIEIDEDEKTVEGLVVACSYSQLAEQALGNLRQKIEVNRWDIKAQQMPKLELG